jgi:hypothetical protein
MIAQNFTAKDAKRDITTVMTIATPLMVWLDEAPNRTDREARMSALRRVDSGNIYTVSRATTPASEIIAMASVYYRFIVAQ